MRGRIRVKIPAAQRNAAVLKEIADSVKGIHGIQDIQTNLHTGSIVVHYDHKAHPDFHESLSTHGEASGVFSLAPPELSEVDQIARDLEREAEFLAAHSEAARTIVEAVKTVNFGLKRMTNNNLDLKVLLPLGLAAWAFVEHDPEIATPLWLTLSAFSFNSFVALHAPAAGVAVETQQVIRKEGDHSVEVRATRSRPRKRT